ncbi:Epoxide hydrolase domain-containing protein [Paenibacillus alvei TS-15]|uniref:Epoxide hydrolase domain-containing protein n=1 Tax=Paenibacillus alvei TS-15 TaxID=1117108 RepID=S9SRM1_PAEAL|nr:alpha/beta hydrolase [Paenibacillus alvei]EPY07344.1 Epoxide hydrolase domain-containing protein [Paenibacillus alvei TS-15]
MRIVFPHPFRRQKTDEEPVYNGHHLFTQNNHDLLANVSIYWFTQTINAANRYYYEGRHIKWPGEGEICNVPHGVSLTKTQPHERPPREYVERLFPNILQWQELNAGGHFVALEQPGLVAESIRSFFKTIQY